MLEEFSDEFSSKLTFGCLEDLLSERVLPMESRPALGLRLLLVNDFEDTRPEFGSELSENAIGFKCLNDKVLQLIHLNS